MDMNRPISDELLGILEFRMDMICMPNGWAFPFLKFWGYFDMSHNNVHDFCY